MPRIEDYKKAAEIAREELLPKNPKRIAGMCGAQFHGRFADKISLEMRFLDKDVKIDWPKLVIYEKDTGKELPIQEQVLILHYMRGCLKGVEITKQWISYQDLPDGRFYMDAFVKRAKKPMIDAFGKDPGLLVELSKKLYDAKEFDKGDYSVLIKALPYVPVVLILWEGDEEFPPDGTILFDMGIRKILSAEDIAWLSGMIIYRLIGELKR